jgi:hypothetical protein
MATKIKRTLSLVPKRKLQAQNMGLEMIVQTYRLVQVFTRFTHSTYGHEA